MLLFRHYFKNRRREKKEKRMQVSRNQLLSDQGGQINVNCVYTLLLTKMLNFKMAEISFYCVTVYKYCGARLRGRWCNWAHGALGNSECCCMYHTAKSTATGPIDSWVNKMNHTFDNTLVRFKC